MLSSAACPGRNQPRGSRPILLPWEQRSSPRRPAPVGTSPPRCPGVTRP